MITTETTTSDIELADRSARLGASPPDGSAGLDRAQRDAITQMVRRAK